jgi:ABC-type spermidine/putrescine transport system permease subunit I
MSTRVLASTGPAAVRARPVGRGYWLLGAPLLIYSLVLFVVPALTVLRTSAAPDPGLNTPGFTASHYGNFFSNSLYLTAWKNTIETSIITVLLIGVVGLLYAYGLVLHPRFRQLQMALLVAPLFVNGVVRIFGLQLGLDALNRFLVWAGIVGSPLKLEYSYTGVVIALAMFEFPYMAMAIYASLARLDPSLAEAARTLGANRWAVIRSVVLPSAMPGLIAGAVLTFAASAGSYIIPAMMGGGRINTLAQMVYSSVSQSSQWGTGSALAIILSITLLVPIVALMLRTTTTVGSR